MINSNDVVLFIGDSVTDCGRNREVSSDMGNGYAMLAGAWFSALYPEKNVTFYNRGISGNRVVDLQDRWKEDCLDLKPDVISILIGINDCWRRFDRNDPTSAEKFESGYRDILNQIKENLPKAKIILCEPFVLPVPEDRKSWREDLDPKIHVVRKLSLEFNTLYIPLDGVLAQAAANREPAFWAQDGVHPTKEGHAIVAQQWLKAVKAI